MRILHLFQLVNENRRMEYEEKKRAWDKLKEEQEHTFTFAQSDKKRGHVSVAQLRHWRLSHLQAVYSHVSFATCRKSADASWTLENEESYTRIGKRSG